MFRLLWLKFILGTTISEESVSSSLSPSSSSWWWTYSGVGESVSPFPLTRRHNRSDFCRTTTTWWWGWWGGLWWGWWWWWGFWGCCWWWWLIWVYGNSDEPIIVQSSPSYTVFAWYTMCIKRDCANIIHYTLSPTRSLGALRAPTSRKRADTRESCQKIRVCSPSVPMMIITNAGSTNTAHLLTQHSW